MRIDRAKVLETLIKQKALDERLRGAQPSMTLGCFYDLKIEDDSICKECRSYPTCYSYLKHYGAENNSSNANKNNVQNSKEDF